MCVKLRSECPDPRKISNFRFPGLINTFKILCLLFLPFPYLTLTFPSMPPLRFQVHWAQNHSRTSTWVWGNFTQQIPHFSFALSQRMRKMLITDHPPLFPGVHLLHFSSIFGGASRAKESFTWLQVPQTPPSPSFPWIFCVELEFLAQTGSCSAPSKVEMKAGIPRALMGLAISAENANYFP